MCRFLLVRSEQPIDPQPLLQEFAAMCEKSRAPDGDWQGDGYGIAWNWDGKWQLYKSLVPIWKETKTFQTVGETDLFVAHARSAGFPQHKGIVQYNQPYIRDSFCFVFNGMIRGVKLSIPLEGTIGAQKIFSLFLYEAQKSNTDMALRSLRSQIHSHAKAIEGMNIGVVHEGKLHALCDYEKQEDYFGLRFAQKGSLSMICSQPLRGFHWTTMTKGEVKTI